MKRQVLALVGAVALAAPLIGTIPVQAATPRAVPDAPVITSVNPGPLVGTVEVDWEPPNSPGILDYQIRYHVAPTGDWVDAGSTDDAVTIAVIEGLAGGKQYVFQVRARNADGSGPWSADSSLVSPPGIAPPGPVTATPGDGSVNLTWAAAVPPALGYEIQYRLANQGSVFGDTRSTSSTSYRVTDLDPAKSYFFRVRASNGNDNVSIWVETNAPVSPAAAPGPPSSLVAAPGDSQVALSWSAPFPAPTGYQVQYAVNGTTNWLPQTPTPVTTTSTTVTGLTNGTAYNFRVRSARGDSTSDWVVTATPVTPNGSFVVPAAPTSLMASPGDGLAFMYWTVPAGNPTTNYEVQYSTNNAAWFPNTPIRTNSTALSYTLGGLSNGVPYYLRVRTVNGSQVSSWTQMAGVVVPLGVPGAPTGVSGVAGNSQVTLSWIPPVNTGIAVTGYRIQYSVNGGVSWVPAVDLAVAVTSWTITGLSNGTGYIFRVRATSHSGDGPWSANSPTIVPPGAPNPPTNTFAVAGNASASVGWTAPAGTQGYPILGYRVTASPGGQICTTSATPPALPATTCNVTGLTNGQAYTFTVVAISNSGVSASSAPSTPVVPVGGPAAPTAVTAVAGDRSATVSWTPSTSTAGGPVTSYRVTSSPDGRTCTTQATPPATPATTCTVNGLTNGQAYTFTVVAISSTGTSASSPASAPVTPFTTQVTIRITDSSRDGRKIIIKGTTQGVDPGDTLDVLIRNSGKGKFDPAGEVTVKSNGTFRWTSTNVNRTWVRVTDGDVVSNTVIIPAR